ncbi:hypothetical protein B0H15DRAFT_951139 [Mycena belliarum]|uniref:Uncharacterized protein n=1 Tax=Mycena belliarum TaxID=1033014 RepID=A0AAD6U0X1_9AGAR|nr:hypothetical protein B0H15DRAFT_951139 [Mycena belliae]
MQRLAQELLDAILDCLQDDTESLRNSSLVARAWISTPRRHLFRRIAINSFFAVRYRHNAHSFLELCDSPHRTFRVALQSVVLDINNAELLDKILDALEGTSFTELFFIDYFSENDHPGALTRLGARLPPQVERLSYNSPECATGTDLFFLPASLPNLRSLVVHLALRSIEKPTLYFPPPATASLAHLQTVRLRMSGQHLAQALAWFQATDARVETLDVEIIHYFHNGWGPVAGINAFLQASREWLRHLHLRVSYDDNSDIDELERVRRAADGPVDLSPLTNIRTLHLRSHDLEAVCTALDSLPKELSSIGSVEIATILWPISGDSDDEGESDATCQCDLAALFARLARSMGGAQFSHLLEFALLIPDVFDEESVNAVGRLFPLWKENRALKVGFTHSSDHQEDSWRSVSDLLNRLAKRDDED